MKINWKQIVKDVDVIVNNDWGAEVDMKLVFNRKFTQAEAKEMASALMKIYRITHCVYKNCCLKEKYIIK